MTGILPTPAEWARYYRRIRRRTLQCPARCYAGRVYARPSDPPELYPSGIRCTPDDPRRDREYPCVYGCGDSAQVRLW